MSKKIVLFDVDGTLTVPRKKAPEHIHQLLAELRKVVTIGIVGGSDLSKIKEQLGDNVLDTVDYTFSENGLVAHKGKEKLAVQSIKTFLGEDDLKSFINFVLKYVADLDIPVKRGTFIEFRNGMLNVSPIGRNCSQEERDAFEQFDNGAHVRPPELWTTIDMIALVEWPQYCEYCEVMKRQIRVCKMPGKKMVEVLKAEFAALGLTYSIGGQISFDVFPTGWDKTYCLQFVETEFDEIHFFGDKTYQGGNDYEIYESDMTIGHHTTGPEDTIKQCKELFFS